MNKLMQMWKSGTLLNQQIKCQGQIRTVVFIYADILGGVRLDKLVNGFYSWNVEDLELCSIT